MVKTNEPGQMRNDSGATPGTRTAWRRIADAVETALGSAAVSLVATAAVAGVGLRFWESLDITDVSEPGGSAYCLYAAPLTVCLALVFGAVAGARESRRLFRRHLLVYLVAFGAFVHGALALAGFIVSRLHPGGATLNPFFDPYMLVAIIIGPPVIAAASAAGVNGLLARRRRPTVPPTLVVLLAGAAWLGHLPIGS
jgi:hypothetical protein